MFHFHIIKLMFARVNCVIFACRKYSIRSRINYIINILLIVAKIKLMLNKPQIDSLCLNMGKAAFGDYLQRRTVEPVLRTCNFSVDSRSSKKFTGRSKIFEPEISLVWSDDRSLFRNAGENPNTREVSLNLPCWELNRKNLPRVFALRRGA